MDAQALAIPTLLGVLLLVGGLLMGWALGSSRKVWRGSHYHSQAGSGVIYHGSGWYGRDHSDEVTGI